MSDVGSIVLDFVRDVERLTGGSALDWFGRCTPIELLGCWHEDVRLRTADFVSEAQAAPDRRKGSLGRLCSMRLADLYAIARDFDGIAGLPERA